VRKEVAASIFFDDRVLFPGVQLIRTIGRLIVEAIRGFVEEKYALFQNIYVQQTAKPQEWRSGVDHNGKFGYLYQSVELIARTRICSILWAENFTKSADRSGC
jgi:hypothetical protein